MAIGDRPTYTYQAKYGSKLGSKYKQKTSGLTRAQLEKRAKRAAAEKKRTARARTDPYAIAKVGDTWTSLAERFGVEPTTVAQANKTQKPKAGTAVNIPNVSPRYFDPQFGPGETSEEGIVYPEGYNPQQFGDWAAGMGQPGLDVSGVSKEWWQQPEFLGAGMTDEEVYAANQLVRGRLSERQYDLEQQFGQTKEDRAAIQKQLDKGKYYQEGMFEMPGMALYNRWERDENNKWVDREKENYFDALYEANGIDPTNPDMVEYFWSFADDDLLFMGEFFDVLEWPTGGGGGVGGYEYELPEYQRGEAGRGAPPRRDNFNAYLQLTSWRI